MDEMAPPPDGGASVIGSDADDAIYLGREVKEDGRIGDKICYGGSLNMVLLGPNGTGKGMRCLITNLLSISGRSILILDPKAQAFMMTAAYRRMIGDEVVAIDPFGLAREIAGKQPKIYRDLIEAGLVESAGFNPFRGLDPKASTFYDDAKVIAEALIKIQGNDPHWTESAQGFVTALVMWESVRNGAQANLENVRAMLTEPDVWESYYDKKAKRHREGLVRGLSVTAARMVKEGGFEIASLAARFLSDTPSNEMEGVRSTADTQTVWLLSRPMRADLKKPGVDFRKLKHGPRPMTVYVILPAKFLETHSVWLRLVVSEALRASLTADGRRTLLALDEFAALGHLPIVERFWPVVRDYGVQMWAILQDLPQLKAIYKDRWETVLGMAGVVHSFRAGDLTTAEWLSKRTGTTTVVAASYSRGSGTSGTAANSNSGLSYQQIARPTVPADDMFGIKDGGMLAWFAGEQKPVRVYAPKFNTYTNTFARRAMPNPYFKGPR